MRLIDGDALEKAISLSHTMTDDYGIKTGYEIAMRLVEDAPTIEPERKKGKWILHKDGSGTCDQCRFTQIAVWDYDGWQNFCGHCGAKMEEGEQE